MRPCTGLYGVHTRLLFPRLQSQILRHLHLSTALSSASASSPVFTHPSRSEPALEAESESQHEPLIYPSRPSASNHHDLASFLVHAERTGLSPKTTVYVGTRYEYTVLDALAPHGFKLHRVGGASDYGIDLLGTWSLPSLTHPLRVILQCKALSSRGPRPEQIRELEGAFIGAPPGWRRGEGLGNVLGLLVAPGPSTKGVRDAMSRSRWPMGFVSCARDTGVVKQFLWNQAAVREGLEGVGVAPRHDEAGEDTPRLALTWKGKPIDAGVEKEEVSG